MVLILIDQGRPDNRFVDLIADGNYGGARSGPIEPFDFKFPLAEFLLSI
jgi:hypothetical protein